MISGRQYINLTMICQLQELTQITNKHQEPGNARLGSSKQQLASIREIRG
jgi:hypothetical protein